MAKHGRGGKDGKRKGGREGGGKGKKGGGEKKAGRKNRGGGERRGESVPIGLMNIGNTCFFNAVMQNLNRLQSVREHFLKANEGIEMMEGAMTAAFREHVRCMRTEGDTYSPDRLFNEIERRAPRFKGRNQQDSHEVFRTILDGIIEEERQRLRDEEGSETESGDGKSSLEARKRKTVFENVFEGSLSSTLMCAECQHESKVTEPFLDLSLALKSYPTSFVQRQRSPSESPVEKKKKTGPRSSQSKKNRLKRAEKTGSPGNCKRGRVSDHDEHDERNPTSLVHSQEHNGGSEVQTDDGGEVVSLFHTFDLSDEMQEPAREVMSSNGGEEYDMEDAMLFSLFDDVEDIPTPPSEDSQIAPVDDFELSPSRTLNSLGSKNEFMSLLESLASFLGPEILDGDDRPVCEECSKRASEVEPAKAPLPPPTATSPSELEKALESSSECSDNTVGAEKSDRSSSVGSGAEDARDESHDGGGKVTKVRTRSIKRYSIQSLPPVLVLQLNRFQQVSPYGGLRKLRGQCHFPPTLDLSDYFAKEGSTRYQLSGVVCHSGSLRGGHYTAYVNSEPKSDRWFYCSDANIQPANEDDVLKSEPYLLFYEQCR